MKFFNNACVTREQRRFWRLMKRTFQTLGLLLVTLMIGSIHVVAASASMLGRLNSLNFTTRTAVDWMLSIGIFVMVFLPSMFWLWQKWTDEDIQRRRYYYYSDEEDGVEAQQA